MTADSAASIADGAASSVRDATRDDLPAIAAIYTHYVLRTTITFNTQVRTPREWIDLFDVHVTNGRYHLVVAEVSGQVVGFTLSQRFREKQAYDQSLELSVYVAPDAVGQRIGDAMYRHLLGRLEADTTFHRAYALIALPNDASERFHRRWGFELRGTLTEVGHKFGRYLDVAYYERAL